MAIRWSGFVLLAVAVTAIQYNPVPITGVGDSDCALLLHGPGRSSSFDYNLNLLRGSFGYNGAHTCITYDAVNAAYIDARKRVNIAQPHGDWRPEDVATVGELLLDVSINLARTYGLNYEDIEKGLPLIDTSKTLIREVCPNFLSHVECRPGKYRRFDGLCNNLQHPTWGATRTPFQRLIGPLYADGMNAPRISVTGRPLPLSRVVSRTIHPDEGYHDHAGTVMVIAWGQFIDHDYTLTATPLDPINRNDPEECCMRPPHLKNPYCNEILVPEDDYFYRLFNVRCIDFVRGFPAVRPGCRLGSRAQFNTLTATLDGNTIYGVTEEFARKLRSGYGGQLRMNPAFQEYGLKDLLPLKLDIPDEGCTRPNKSMFCFEAGEIRVNEQLVLTCMHTLMAREHNRIAEGLAHVNPHWDDETLFQEARRINIAEIQHITYNEFLPILLGKDVMEKFGLLTQKDGYWDGYDPSVNPGVIDAFAAAAYRFGHSLLPTAVERWSKAHKFIASKRLSDLIRRPQDLYRPGIFDEYFMGLMNQVAQAMDDSITQEVTNHLFKKPGKKFGHDLVSFNMQRGREFGLPGYMEFRKFCGLPGAETFDELFGAMPNDTVHRYSTIFEHPSDVDLWSGGVSEKPLPGSLLGPTFACIIATQFSYSKRGDRFWYELPHQPSSFTPEQLQEVRKARMARLICDNTDLIDSIQLYPMVLPDHEINPRVPCRSGVIPSIDFSKWADHAGAALHHQQPPFPSPGPEDQKEQSTRLRPKALLKGFLVLGKGVAPLGRTLLKASKKIRVLSPIVYRGVARALRRGRRSTDQATEAVIVHQVSGDPPEETSEQPADPEELNPLVITPSESPAEQHQEAKEEHEEVDEAQLEEDIDEMLARIKAEFGDLEKGFDDDEVEGRPSRKRKMKADREAEDEEEAEEEGRNDGVKDYEDDDYLREGEAPKYHFYVAEEMRPFIPESLEEDADRPEEDSMEQERAYFKPYDTFDEKSSYFGTSKPAGGYSLDDADSFDANRDGNDKEYDLEREMHRDVVQERPEEGTERAQTTQETSGDRNGA